MGLPVRRFLNQKIPARWTGSNAADSLATLFTRLFLTSWACIKVIIYHTTIRVIAYLEQKITEAIATTDEDVLQRLRQGIECHLGVLRATCGADVEVWEIRQK